MRPVLCPYVLCRCGEFVHGSASVHIIIRPSNKGFKMIELCKRQILPAFKKMEQGLYVGNEADKVLLPNKEVPDGVAAGDLLDVYIYLDSKDRYTATLKSPKIELDSVAMLQVTDVTDIGAFLDWGLDKDLFLPFKEQIYKVKKGDIIPVMLYLDKSYRPAATMYVYNNLKTGGGYVKDSAVSGTVIRINPDIGVYVAVDDKYYGMIPAREVGSDIKLGDKIHGRVAFVRDDGKYMISLRQKAYIQIDADSAKILDILKESGSVPYGDKSDANDIKRVFNMSKGAFKRAIGHLYKNGVIELEPEKIKLKEV